MPTRTYTNNNGMKAVIMAGDCQILFHFPFDAALLGVMPVNPRSSFHFLFPFPVNPPYNPYIFPLNPKPPT